jgi:hypothetical protein
LWVRKQILVPQSTSLRLCLKTWGKTDDADVCVIVAVAGVVAIAVVVKVEYVLVAVVVEVEYVVVAVVVLVVFELAFFVAEVCAIQSLCKI